MAENVILQATSIFAAGKSVFTSKNFKFGSGSKIVEIDTVLSWDASSDKNITSLPLEIGANINDHSYLNPTIATVVISESKFGNVIDQINSISNNFREVSKEQISTDLLNKNLSFYQTTKATEKLQEIYSILEDLEIKFVLELPEARYSNMTLKSINPRGDTSTQGGFNAVLVFQQLNIVGELSEVGLLTETGFKNKIDVAESVSTYVNGLLGRDE